LFIGFSDRYAIPTRTPLLVSEFLYEMYASFYGEPAYNDWFLALYNVFLSSLPVIALCIQPGLICSILPPISFVI